MLAPNRRTLEGRRLRTLRVILAGMIVLVFLSGLGGATVGQTEAEDDVPVGVVIEVAEAGKVERGQYSKKSGLDYGTLLDRIYVEEWEANDPRLSGDATNRVMRHEYDDLGLFLESSELILVNDGGTWVGNSRGIAPTGRVGEYGHIFTTTLHGEGAYDGLTAFLTFGNEMADDFHWTLRGVIIGDDLPPFPEPLAE